MTDTQSKIIDISCCELTETLANGATLYDVREVDEFNTGSIPGATHLALSELPTSEAIIPKNNSIILFCRSGRRSSKAAKIISNWTDHKLFCLTGGYKAYCEFNPNTKQPS